MSLGCKSLSQRKLRSSEIRFLQETLSDEHKLCSIRLREGEYQYSLAKAVASFQLELYLPDVKDVIKRLYGEEKANDIQFRRKIQTMLKKMEKNGVIRILPKKEPWELQRYALSGFRFQDAEKNLVILATDQQIRQMQNLLHSMLSQQEKHVARIGSIRIFAFAFIVAASYSAILWGLMQPTINPIILVPAISIAVVCSLMLGKALSHE